VSTALWTKESETVLDEARMKRPYLLEPELVIVLWLMTFQFESIQR
jgi:hypothetical protein